MDKNEIINDEYTLKDYEALKSDIILLEGLLEESADTLQDLDNKYNIEKDNNEELITKLNEAKDIIMTSEEYKEDLLEEIDSLRQQNDDLKTQISTMKIALIANDSKSKTSNEIYDDKDTHSFINKIQQQRLDIDTREATLLTYHTDLVNNLRSLVDHACDCLAEIDDEQARLEEMFPGVEFVEKTILDPYKSTAGLTGRNNRAGKHLGSHYNSIEQSDASCETSDAIESEKEQEPYIFGSPSDRFPLVAVSGSSGSSDCGSSKNRFPIAHPESQRSFDEEDDSIKFNAAAEPHQPIIGQETSSIQVRDGIEYSEDADINKRESNSEDIIQSTVHKISERPDDNPCENHAVSAFIHSNDGTNASSMAENHDQSKQSSTLAPVSVRNEASKSTSTTSPSQITGKAPEKKPDKDLSEDKSKAANFWGVALRSVRNTVKATKKNQDTTSSDTAATSSANTVSKGVKKVVYTELASHSNPTSNNNNDSDIKNHKPTTTPTSKPSTGIVKDNSKKTGKDVANRKKPQQLAIPVGDNSDEEEEELEASSAGPEYMSPQRSLLSGTVNFFPSEEIDLSRSLSRSRSGSTADSESNSAKKRILGSKLAKLDQIMSRTNYK